jgi:hypothetical protein
MVACEAAERCHETTAPAPRNEIAAITNPKRHRATI